MKTVIFADLHLGTLAYDSVGCYVAEHITDTDTIILDGDTFELIFPYQHVAAVDIKATGNVLTQIIDANHDLFDALNNSSAKKAIIITGEHDYKLAEEPLRRIVAGALDKIETIVCDHWYDPASKSLVVHGHEFDYNRIFRKNGGYISCIDGLTIALADYLGQSKNLDLLREMTEREMFSHWYGPGGLPSYVRAVASLFGNNPRDYANRVAGILQGPETQAWLREHKSKFVHFAGRAAREIARYPSLLLPAYAPAHHALEHVMRYRIRRVLEGRRYIDAPDYLFNYPEVANLITGHSHSSGVRQYGKKIHIQIPSPILHTEGIERVTDNIVTSRQFGFVEIEGGSVRSHFQPIRHERHPVVLQGNSLG